LERDRIADKSKEKRISGRDFLESLVSKKEVMAPQKNLTRLPFRPIPVGLRTKIFKDKLQKVKGEI
jgi:hypothetical protein